MIINPYYVQAPAPSGIEGFGWAALAYPDILPPYNTGTTVATNGQIAATLRDVIGAQNWTYLGGNPTYDDATHSVAIVYLTNDYYDNVLSTSLSSDSGFTVSIVFNTADAGPNDYLWAAETGVSEKAALQFISTSSIRFRAAGVTSADFSGKYATGTWVHVSAHWTTTPNGCWLYSSLDATQSTVTGTMSSASFTASVLGATHVRATVIDDLRVAFFGIKSGTLTAGHLEGLDDFAAAIT